MDLSTTASETLSSGQRRTILVPADDTEATDGVVDWVINHLYCPGDLVQLLHIIPVPTLEVAAGVGYEYYPLLLESDPKEDIAHVAAARRFLKRRALDKLEHANIPFKMGIVHCLTDTTSIGQAICARAEYLQATSVVMAKHQKGVLVRFFLGSVTDYCVQHCKQPLVLLH